MRDVLRRLAHGERYRDLGLLVLRVGLGGSMMLHGWPKLAGGPAGWAKLGTSMEVLGIHFAPTLWGLCAGLAEGLGGLLLAIGLLTRPAAAALAFTMLVAVLNHVHDGDAFAVGWSHAFEDGVAFLAIVLMGPGRFAVDRRL